MLFLTRENKTHIFKPTCNVLKYRPLSLSVMAAMLGFSKQKNFGSFFCFWNQHGRSTYCKQLHALIGSRNSRDPKLLVGFEVEVRMKRSPRAKNRTKVYIVLFL